MTAAYPAPGTFPCVTLTQAQIAKLKAAHAKVVEADAVGDAAREERSKLIRKIEAAGGGRREIARELDVTHRAVKLMAERKPPTG